MTHALAHYRAMRSTAPWFARIAPDARHALYCATKRYGYSGHMNVYHCGFCGGWHLGHSGR